MNISILSRDILLTSLLRNALLLNVMLANVFAANDEFFESPDEFLSQQFEEAEAPLYLGNRFYIGPKVLLIQNNIEPTFGIGWDQHMAKNYSLGVGAFTWISSPENFSFYLHQVVGQPESEFGALGSKVLLFNEYLEEISSTPKSQRGPYGWSDWGVSVSYLKEVIPWKEFYYFPRFEMEIGYRKQPFTRKALFGTGKTSNLWFAAQFSVSVFSPIKE